MLKLLVVLCLSLLPTGCFAQFGFNYSANAGMASPPDILYFHYFEEIDVKTSDHWVEIRANPNAQAFGVTWEMWVEIDELEYDQDVAENQTVTTDGAGVWHRNAHVTRGYCQRIIPANTYPAGEPVAHYANPWASLWLSQLNTQDSSPIRRFDVGS